MSGPYREGEGTPPRKRRPHWKKWLSLTAVLVTVLGWLALLNVKAFVLGLGGGWVTAAWTANVGASFVIAFIGAGAFFETFGEGWWR